jgi:signal transduction histidine kinase
MSGLRNPAIILAWLFGLTVAVVGYWNQWQLSQLPDDLAVEHLRYPIRIADLSAEDAARLRFLVESWPPGTRLTYIDAAGEHHQAPLELRQGRASLVVSGISGFAFLAAAVAIVATRAGTAGATGFFWVTLLYGVGSLCGGVFFPRTHKLTVTAISIVEIGILSLLPVLFVRLALTFPRRSPWLQVRPWLLPSLLAAGTAIVSWQVWTYLQYAREPTPSHGRAFSLPFALADVFMLTVTVLGVVLLLLSMRRLEVTRERKQVRWLIWGFTIGAAPYVVVRTLASLLKVPPPLPAAVDRLAELAIPASFLMAVVRHHFLDVDVIIRRSLYYGVLAAACLALYLAVGLTVGDNLTRSLGLRQGFMAFVLGLAAGGLYLPLRYRLGAWIDRTFFKLAYDQRRALRALDADLDGAATRDDVARRLSRTLVESLGPRAHSVVIEDEGCLRSEGTLPPGASAAALAAHNSGAVGPRTPAYAAPQSTSVPEVERTDFPAELAAEGIAVVMPLMVGDAPAGAAFLGLRPTGRRYIDTDLDFLAECCHLVGHTLARIDLQHAVAAEALARQRSELLTQQKSSFLAQVAHDLRTPLAGIVWSARNLLDGLAGKVTPAQQEYLESISCSGALLNRLVENLLEISRLEQAETSLHLGPVDVAEIWTTAAGVVRPLSQSKAATVVVPPGPAPLVRADRQKLLEVAVNLLDNAVKYTAPDTSVTVTWAATAAGVEVSVADRGPGLRGQPVDVLLHRFFQGEPSPHSTRGGFGLGLYIAATYLKLMGGTITAGDHPQGGAIFTCCLPPDEGSTG